MNCVVVLLYQVLINTVNCISKEDLSENNKLVASIQKRPLVIVEPIKLEISWLLNYFSMVNQQVIIIIIQVRKERCSSGHVDQLIDVGKVV